MTWNPLKKNYMTTKPTWALNVINKADDKELDIIFHRLQHLEETTRRLQKEIKKYLDGVSNLSKLEQRITTDLSSSHLCQQNFDIRQVVQDYHTAVSKGSEHNMELLDNCQQTFQDPLKKYVHLFSSIDVALQKREQMVQECRNISTKVKKLEEKEKTGNNTVKLERERKMLETSSKELIAYHSVLLDELLQFYSKRTEYFLPILQAFVHIQLEYYGNLTSLFTQLFPVATSSTSSSPTSASIPEAQYLENVNSKLAKIKGLAIVRQSRS